MLKWFITFGLLAIVAWRWWAAYKRFLIRRTNRNANGAGAHPAQSPSLNASQKPHATAKPLVVRCHHCAVMLPPELSVKSGPYYFCKEHAPNQPQNQ